ncbi:MAG: hypothetical protein V2I46_04285 [Bacteroides sp.]|jgi:hypothetical protein|nr:hypothetical protein [Bacteroides sp.]
MKYTGIVLLLAAMIIAFGCQKDDEPTPFELLTGPVWASDSLLVNGQNAAGPGDLLEGFQGDAKFNTDMTGTFGTFSGTWRFAASETQLVITSEALPLPLQANIVELSETDLKLETIFPDPENVNQTLLIRLTFKAK